MSKVKAYKVKLVEYAQVAFDNLGSPVEITVFGKSRKEAAQLAEKWAEEHDDDFKTWRIIGDTRFEAKVEAVN